MRALAKLAHRITDADMRAMNAAVDIERAGAMQLFLIGMQLEPRRLWNLLHNKA